MPLDQVVPVPVHVEAREGEPFVLRDGMRVVVQDDPAAVSVATLVAARIGRMGGFPVALVTHDDGADGAIVLRLVTDAAELGVPTDLGAELRSEAYRVDVTAGRVVLTAPSGAGLYRAATTLRQAVRREGGRYLLDPGVVLDHPRFAWRGLSLDVARHFFSVPQVRSVLDVMAGYKLNVLHLHLTDDQGWRLQLASRPELTERSGRTAVGGDPGGFYTREDYAHLLAYAAARHIAVVPEIDVPGHINAALHACAELTPSGEPAPAYTGIDVGFSRLHADLPGTEPFLREVFGELAAMTTGRYVHLGGDEVLSMAADEYAALVRTAARHIAAAGKGVVGWQEVAGVLPDGAGQDVVVQYWDEREGAAEVAEAAARGARVLLSPATKVYLDMRYDADSPLGLDWAGHVEVRDSYDWEPLDVLPGVPAAQVVGIEAGLWTETVRTTEDLFWLLLPRLAAVAEVAWSPAARRDWAGFAPRLAAQHTLWDEAGLTWYRSPQVPWS
ncbi:MAG TPA: family 20 glycosylhydrolase [Actinotalea sp.]|nr:family 20 glycosylhydrolase [Actinotalea sp.]